LGKTNIDPLTYSTLCKVENEEEKTNITCLNLLLTNGNNLSHDFTINLTIHSNSTSSVGDHRSLRSGTTIPLVKKCTRFWDYKITVLGLTSLYRPCYSKNPYNKNDNGGDKKWKEEKAICC
jgi:hypothetical protein